MAYFVAEHTLIHKILYTYMKPNLDCIKKYEILLVSVLEFSQNNKLLYFERQSHSSIFYKWFLTSQMSVLY